MTISRPRIMAFRRLGSAYNSIGYLGIESGHSRGVPWHNQDPKHTTIPSSFLPSLAFFLSLLLVFFPLIPAFSHRFIQVRYWIKQMCTNPTSGEDG